MDPEVTYEDDDAVKSLGILQERSAAYNAWLLDQVQRNDCRRILDVACGTGGDSLFLLDQGMEMVSCDFAEGMLKHARAERTRRSKEPHIAKWEIHQANWLTLQEDLPGYGEFDAVICLGNSIIALLDSQPDLEMYKKSIQNFRSMLKPGGLLLIDHRNMDSVIDRGVVVNRHVYFKENTIHDIEGELVKADGKGKPDLVNITFHMLMPEENANEINGKQGDAPDKKHINKVHVSLCPLPVHRLGHLLKEAFGPDEYALYGDLQREGAVTHPAYYQHVIKMSQ